MTERPTFGVLDLGVLPDGGTILPILSEKQYAVLKYIYDYSLKNRDYPSGAEIAATFSISKQAVTPLLTSLVKKGYAFRNREFVTRNIRLTPAATEKLRIEEGETQDLFDQLP